MEKRIINVESFYGQRAKIPDLSNYIARAIELAGEGNEIVLTGRAPIWLYLKVAHALHGKAIKLIYMAPNTESPETGCSEVVIFDHNAF